MPKKYWQTTVKDKEAEILIFGDLTSWKWEENEVSAYSLAKEIQDLDVDRLNVHIDSYGGEVSEGWAIYNVLKNHPAEVVTYADGFVASAANYPFLAGDRRIASDVSAFFLHNAMTGAWGYADDLRKAADEAEKMTEIGINAFAAAGMDADKVRELMDGETWLDSSEALELGLATEIANSAEGTSPAQSARKNIIQRLKAAPVKQETEEPEEEKAEEIAEEIHEDPQPTILDTILG